MALKDLIASKASLTEDAIEEIIADYARFDPDHRAVVFTPEAHQLPVKTKVLIYLVALQGWPFVLDESVPVDAKPAEIEESTGISGGTLRPILKEMKDRNVIQERGGRYSVNAAALPSIKGELGGSSDARSKRARRRSNIASAEEGDSPQPDKRNRKSVRRTSELKDRFDRLIKEGFFNSEKTLADVQAQYHKDAIIIPQTSIPPYLIAAIRDKLLERDKKKIGNRTVWVYKRKR